MPALAPSLDARPRPGAEQVTTKRFGERFRGKLGFDGLFSDNIPRFTDNARPQLVFDLGKVQYALSALVQATDPCIEALAVRAAPPRMIAATYIAATRDSRHIYRPHTCSRHTLPPHVIAATHTAATHTAAPRDSRHAGRGPPQRRALRPAASPPRPAPLVRHQVSGALQTERFLSGRRGDPRTEVRARERRLGAATLCS